ncbi:MAG: holo-ACP synthase [Alphaproteobacteria bacterium]|nr:holo-ACP synthase [Alphaproteobacteria bacterium]OJV14194.1 MAG: holo-[acyl-carrier-protein] synthase [Alphaproteobacteria bacterium 33-17]
MIYGLGNDVLEIDRFLKITSKYTDEQLLRIFTPKEIELANQKPLYKNKFLAGRFAAKEAFSKAVGTGIGEHIKLNEIETLRDDKGKPFIKLHNQTKIYAENIFPSLSTHISITNTGDLVFVTVILSKV